MGDDLRVAPVLLLIFNRPETTRRVFEAVRAAQPTKLYVAADGPRPEHPTDGRQCWAARQVVEEVDWPCEVRTLFREENLGCGRAVSGALDWFFGAEEGGIVLEDDCLPSDSFFTFCTEQLQRYATDDRIMLVSGFNAQSEWPSSHPGAQYFFSHLGGVWGWASWRRAWKHFDFEMSKLDQVLRQGTLRHLLGNRLGRLRERQFLSVERDQVDTWDYQWGLARHVNSGLAVVPGRSLVQNIGFASDATHTMIEDARADVQRQEIQVPTDPNPIVVADRRYDEAFFPTSGLRGRLRNLPRLWSLAGQSR